MLWTSYPNPLEPVTQVSHPPAGALALLDTLGHNLAYIVLEYRV